MGHTKVRCPNPLVPDTDDAGDAGAGFGGGDFGNGSGDAGGGGGEWETTAVPAATGDWESTPASGGGW
jgi:hypothetical protein